MSAASDVLDHATAIFAAAATAVADKVNAEPKRYLKDSLGKKLVYLMMDEVREAAGAENFSDLDQ